MLNLSIILQPLAWMLLIFVDPLRSDRQEVVLIPRDIYGSANYQTSPAELPSALYHEQQNPVTGLIAETQARNQYYYYGPAVTPNPSIQPFSPHPERLKPKQANPQTSKNPFQESDERSKNFQAQNPENSSGDIELQRKLKDLDEILSDSTANTFDANNGIEDKGFSDADIPEETKRVVRQIRKQRPGFFWTLAKLAFETYNDTRSAYQQISKIINDGLAPETTTRKPVTSDSLMKMKTSTTSVNGSNVTVTTTRPRTTTEPFRLTRTALQGIIRRNLRGLVRLFNIEWRDALNQSDITVKEFQQDLGKQVGMYLKDNPDVY